MLNINFITLTAPYKSNFSPSTQKGVNIAKIYCSSPTPSTLDLHPFLLSHSTTTEATVKYLKHPPPLHTLSLFIALAL